MKLRCRVPLFTYVIGASLDALNLESEFGHDDLIVKLKLSGEEPRSSVSFPKDSRYFLKITSLDFFIEKLEIEEVKKSEYPNLLRILTPIINRVLRNIRNFGIVAHVNEIYPRDEDAEHYLGRWEVELSVDGENWKSVVPDTLLQTLLFFARTEKIGRLRAASWPDIEEAIQDNLDPPPEQEFMTNAIEYLELRNYRLALLESIICLEIVMTQYIRKYLSIQKRIPRERIDEFVSPQLGLKARVSALLNLCLNADDIATIEFNNVLEAINWRNTVIHRTGHLPKVKNEEERRENISSVLKLVSLLARRRDEIETLPKTRKMAKTISEKHGVPVPQIWLLDRHRVLVEFFFVTLRDFPEKQVLEAVAQEASAQLCTRDPRFKPEEHLHIRYIVFPRNIRARWYNGRLHLLPNKS